MFTSHEEEVDFYHFFESFVDLIDRFNLPFDPQFIVTDACHAMANAIKSHFPLCTILMCYFHVKYNVRKHRALIPAAHYRSVQNDIKKLHMCTDEGSYKLLLRSVLAKWNTMQMPQFVEYFRKQWIFGKFRNWQIFLTPPGYAHTNSPIESHNRTIKDHFTVRTVFHLIPAIESCLNLVSYESKNLKKIVDSGRVTRAMKDLAEVIVEEDRLVDIGGGCFSYSSTTTGED